MMKILLRLLLLTCTLACFEETIEQPIKPPKAAACWREAHLRGPASLPNKKTQSCPENRELAHKFCYPKCPADKVGEGMWCLQDCTKLRYKISALPFCCENAEVCDELLALVNVKLPNAMSTLAKDVLLRPARVWADFQLLVEDTLQLNLPQCHKIRMDDMFPDNDDDDDEDYGEQTAVLM